MDTPIPVRGLGGGGVPTRSLQADNERVRETDGNPAQDPAAKQGHYTSKIGPRATLPLESVVFLPALGCDSAPPPRPS